jgi:hypothetical protein
MRRADRPAFSDSIVTAIYHYLKNSLSLSKGLDASRLLICLLCWWVTRLLRNIRVATEGEGGATSDRFEVHSAWKFAGDYNEV